MIQSNQVSISYSISFSIACLRCRNISCHDIKSPSSHHSHSLLLFSTEWTSDGQQVFLDAWSGDNTRHSRPTVSLMLLSSNCPSKYTVSFTLLNKFTQNMKKQKKCNNTFTSKVRPVHTLNFSCITLRLLCANIVVISTDTYLSGNKATTFRLSNITNRQLSFDCNTLWCIIIIIIVC